jgi:hypothetical protein
LQFNKIRITDRLPGTWDILYFQTFFPNGKWGKSNSTFFSSACPGILIYKYKNNGRHSFS